MNRRKSEFEKRFWEKVFIPVDVVTGCWLWTGSKSSSGYGQFRLLRGSLRSAHRLSYMVIKGVVISGAVELDHLCRIRACVNPAHLEEVSHSQNVKRGLCGSSFWNVGSKAAGAKLDEEKVEEMRRLYATGLFSQPELARKFGVSQSNVCWTLKGRFWKHVPGALK